MSTPAAHEHELVPVEEVAALDDEKLWPVVQVVGHRCCVTPCTYYEEAEATR